MLAQGFSFRSRDLRELIAWKSKELILRGEFDDEGRSRTRALRVHSRGNEVRENGEALKSPTSFFGTCPAVIMQPSDIELLRGGPEVRRHWLDEILCYRSSSNAQVLRRYKRVLQQRNKWLKEFKQNGAAVGGEDLFRVLTQQLIDLGAKLWAARLSLSKEVSEIITRYYRKLSGGVDEITCAYKSSILKTLDALDAADPLSDEMMDEIPADAAARAVHDAEIARVAADNAAAYDAGRSSSENANENATGSAAEECAECAGVENSDDVVSEEMLRNAFARKLADLDFVERLQGMTMAGPHRDDLSLCVSGYEMRSVGSQGQCRSAAVAGSHAEGYATSSKSVTASATGSHAEGYTTTASAQAAHAEGYNTTASGYYSHAEGYYTTASGGSSHAEGYNTTASGARAHAEGNFTTANHASQHVFGEYNILDDSTASTSSRGNYVEIVGNGIDSTTRSNARTLDWDGNEVLAGGLTATTINNYTLGPACEKDIATSVTSGSTDLVTAGAVYTAIDNLPEPMVFKGSLGTGGTITALPVDGSASVGDTYKVITAGTYAGQAADVGDTFICDSKTSDANTWTLIPSGDDTVADTWRNIKINGTEKLGTGISTGAVDFVNGTGTTASFDTTGSKVSYSVTYGNSANTACQGNDSRLSNARTPTSHTHGNIQNGGTLQTTDITIADGDKLVVTDSSDSSKIARTSIAFDGSTTTKALTQKGTFESLPSSASSATTGISISDHSTTSITGVQSSTTTASKVTLGTAISVPNVTSAGSASNWVFEDITVPKAASTATSIPNVTAVGSGSFTSGAFDGGSGTFTATVTNGTLSFSHTHTAATHGADSHTHTAPTLGTAISVTGVSGSTTASHVKSGGNGTAPTLGTAISIPNVTGATDVTVPIKNTSSTTVVTSKTHTVTDNGHTHTLS